MQTFVLRGRTLSSATSFLEGRNGIANGLRFGRCLPLFHSLPLRFDLARLKSMSEINSLPYNSDANLPRTLPAG